MLLIASGVLAAALAGLPIGTPVWAAIAGGAPRLYAIELRESDFLFGRIDQGDADLTIRVLGPSGEEVARFDARDHGEEIVAFVTDRPGLYQVVIAPAGRVTRARFSMHFDRPRSGLPADHQVAAAAAAATNGRGLTTSGGRDARMRAVQLLLAAQSGWRDAGFPAPALAAGIQAADALYGLSEYARAEPLYREAMTACADSSEKRLCANVLNNLGVTCWRLNASTEAVQLLEQAANAWRALRSPYGEAGARNNLSLLLQERGRYDDALRQLDRALVLIRQAGDKRGEAFIQNAKGAALDQLGQSAAGLRALRVAIALFRETGDRLAEGRALLSKSTIEFRRSSVAVAQADARAALALIQAAGNRAAEADAHLQLGRVLAPANRTEARVHFDAALGLYRDLGSRRGEADVLHALGLEAFAAGGFTDAAGHFEQALTLRRATGLKRGEADSLYQRARARRAAGDLDRARADLESALAIVEQLRAGLFERELRSSYLGSNRPYYAEYVDVLIAMHRAQPGTGYAFQAFRAAERLRARGLLDSIGTKRALLAGTPAADLQRRERELRERINQQSFLLWQLAAGPEAREREAALSADVDELLRQYANLEAEIARTTPGLRATFLADNAFPAVQRDLLDPDTALLQWVLGDERSYLFAVTSDAIEILDLPPRATIEPAAIALHRLLGRDPGGTDRTAAYRGAAGTLGRFLLTGFSGAMRRARLVMVPDGALHYVPFAAVLDPVTTTPLIEHFELVTVPSATTLAVVRGNLQRRRPAKTIAIVADPVFESADPRVRAPAAIAAPAPPPRLRRLSFSRDEADRVAALVPTSMAMKALDFDASRELLTRGGVKPYRIVHFATHAIQDDAHPELSGVVLSLVGPDGSSRDGFLRLQDLHALPLEAELVVLSACTTGIGARNAGVEGISSLARGFFAAGVPSVVASLWAIDDEATAELITSFYGALLRDRRPVAAALRSAQRSLFKSRRFRDPYYWAAFAVQGTW